ncbi:MAG TPA: CheR family methyltransferase, partial [Burkholderiaceae bacterium]|nr:CheR family methyltransferase [Burkholderiaceae bacterium]
MQLTVVAIGASAGGLAALREFFSAATADPRIAYVVVTHLPAHHVSNLAELLGRTGVLPARELADGEHLTGGQVHVMPPGQLMALRQGAIRFEPQAILHTSGRKPIDFFMTSLAEQVPEHCVGIVLSGTDHDGTLGLKAIKAAGGLTMVQTPGMAEFSSMPQSAIAAGAADRILSAHDMPAALSAYLGRRPSDAGADGAEAPDNPEDADRLNAVLTLVLARTGNDFRLYRTSMLRRRLSQRMALKACIHPADYMALLDQSPDEAAALSAEFLIGVTDFFRDSEAWQEVERLQMPALVAQRQVDDLPFRVWTPGCSSGEESYSIAMLLQEQLAGHGATDSVQIFGTDIDHEALAVARKGVYPDSIASTVSPQRLARFFDRQDGHFAVRKSLRDAVMFAPQNLVRDTPFSRLDMVLCRNVLMYFDPALQERVIRLFHFALKPGGLLWLGRAESLPIKSELFEPVSRDVRLFRRLGGRAQLPPGYVVKGNLAVDWQRRDSEKPAQVAEISRQQLGQRQVDAAVLIDRNSRALHFQGDVARFMAPQGDASLDLQRLVRPELRVPLRTALRQSLGERRAVQRRTTVGAMWVTLQAEPVAVDDSRGLSLVTFNVANPAGAREQAAPTDVTVRDTVLDELHESRRELALALEDAERNNEDLRIAGEEASSLNEELQSSNEELESSKEELQSLNEELSTVNAELEDKIVEVRRNADDVANLLDSTHIPTVLLDGFLHIRRFTPAAASLFHLRASDEGRRLNELASTVSDPHFNTHCSEVLDSGQPSEEEVASGGGAVYLRRILPYRTGKGDIDGLVVTFVDVSQLRKAAEQSRRLQATLEDSNDAVFSYNAEGGILFWNEGANRAYGHDREQAMQVGFFGLVPDKDRDAARQVIATVIASGSIGPQIVDRMTRDGQTVHASVTVSALRDDRGRSYALLSTERDITERLRIEGEIRFRRLADDIPSLLRVEDIHGMAEFVNRACIEFTGRPREMLLGHGWLQLIHPQERDAYLAQQAAAKSAHAPLEVDFRLLRSDGVYRWMRSISKPYADAAGQFAGFVAMMLDAEDRKRAETALLTADRRKDEFLAMLAHELRNPLAPVSNAARVLAASGTKDDRILWAAGVIERQTAVLAKLLDSLLDVARIASGKTRLELAPVDLRVVLTRAVEMCEPVCKERRQRLRVSFSDTQELMVEGDVVRLIQVLANLLNNASKYSDEGSDIRVDLERIDGDAVVHVVDTGAGLSEDFIPHIFDLFRQADRTLDRAKGGLGLGLTLVRQLVELHRGSVMATSAGLGKGSRFTVRLPLLAGAPAIRFARDTAIPDPTGSGLRILVVDDHVDGAATLAMVLQSHGHRIAVAHDGATALDMSADGADVVILDVGLPGMDGYTVARTLRGRPDTADVMLLALTGYGQPEDLEKALAAGFNGHLIKPVDFDRLLALLANRVPRTER